MARKKRKIAAKREWLTPRDPETQSYVAYAFHDYDDGALTVTIADCNRRVSLYFEDSKSGRAKYDRLLKVLKEGREKMDGKDS